MRARPFLLLIAGFATLLAPPASARLGETLADLKKRFGSPQPQAQARKDNAFWLFEGDDGELMYSVTFDAKGISIAEGLKPVKRARFNRTLVMDFIDSQLGPLRESESAKTIKPGEKYVFAGKAYVCGEKEYIVVDDEHGLLIVWNQTGVPSVLVLSPVMMRSASG